MSVIVYEGRGFGFASGLSWSVLSTDGNNKQKVKKIRTQANIIGADKHVLNTLAQNKYIGLYTKPVLDKKLPNKIYSVAMTLLGVLSNHNEADRQAVNAIFLMTPPSHPSHRVVVVIEGGQIIHDKLEDKNDAPSVISQYNNANVGIHYQVVSDGYELAGANITTWEELASAKTSQDILKSIPVNMLVLGLLLVGLMAIAAASAYYLMVYKPAQEQAKRLAQQAAMDQTPQYLKRLNEELLRVGWNKKHLLETLDNLAAEQAYAKGWAIDDIVCGDGKDLLAVATTCDYHFSRVGGELQELVDKHTDKTLDLAKSNKEKAVLVRKITPTLEGYDVNKIPQSNVASVVLLNQIQRLNNADISSSTTNPKPWPIQGLELNKIKKETLINQATFEVKLPYILTHTVMAELPENLMLRGFGLKVSPAGDKAKFLTLTLKGHTYAK